ncbi:MAG: beta-L-arabinofuranosidase domain-containing protein [Dehalococcoidia bacterium]
MSKIQNQMAPLSLSHVSVEDGFWAPRQRTVKQTTIPYIDALWEKTGRFQSVTHTQPDQLYNYESEVGKWLEAASYALVIHPDNELERRIDEVISLVAQGQMSEAGKTWASQHTALYSIGHLIEAGVAHYEATGGRSLLDVACRYADHIDAVFGPEPGKNPGYSGHEEIELALIRLYRTTGEERYLRSAKFFVDERGPHQPALRQHFDDEAKARGDTPGAELQWPSSAGQKYDAWQAHLPVRQQTTAEGHSVMATYLFSGMADVAGETGDAELLNACQTIWKNVTSRRMYITGGIGPSAEGERFTIDYDLPNETAYTETCAAIGLVFWAHRMLQIEGDGRYADVLERALYNGTISGISLDGDRFFYGNPLYVDPKSAYYVKTLPVLARPRVSEVYMGMVLYEIQKRNRIRSVRQETFTPPCCLPNIARLIPSIGTYVYSESEDSAVVHLYVQGTGELRVAGQKVVLRQQTKYPWDGKVTLTIEPERPAAFSLKLRIPGWCRKATISVNGEPQVLEVEKGYSRIMRTWQSGDQVELNLEMPVERVYAHPEVTANTWTVALQRGPIVYCLEEVDNGANLGAVALPRDAELKTRFEEDLLGGVTTISGTAKRLQDADWQDDLYRTEPWQAKSVSIKAVPYAVWCNREPGEMIVWLRET